MPPDGTAGRPSDLPAQRILVVAPHPDDEALGCGGLIATFAREGRAIHVLFVTDGGASHPGSRAWPRPRLAGQRRREAEDALARLGAASAGRTFLGLPDAGMPAAPSAAFAEAQATVASLLAAFRPDLVLLPWRRDPHRDHRDSWTLVQAALRAAGQGPRSLEYAVWLDELGAPADRPAAGEAVAVAFDIADVVEAKRRAVAAHVSQTSDLIDDDPQCFRLTPETIRRLTGPVEAYWRPVP